MKRLAFIASLLTASLMGAGTGNAAVTLGPNPLPGRDAVFSHPGVDTIIVDTAVPGATLVSPFDGVIVRWRAQRTDGPGGLPADTIGLRVLHSTGSANELRATGTSAVQTVPADPDPIGIREFPTQLAIRAGDMIGLESTAGFWPGNIFGGTANLSAPGPLPDGQSATFSTTSGEFVPFNADVEPEVTSITGAPKAKLRTRKKSVRVSFSFQSNAPGVGFSCSLDRTPPAACSSPDSFRARSGRHSFAVQATYLGSAFGAPAADSFRVKRKK